MDSQLIRYAKEASQGFLSKDAPDAWQRSVRAARFADDAVTILGRPRGEIIIAAAWLHAIGESPAAQRTGFVQVDGAVQLLGDGWPTPVVNLVAHHTQARLVAPAFAAMERLAFFERIQGWPSDLLDYAVIMGLADQATTHPEGCVRLAAKQLPTSLRIRARDRSEREKRLRRALERVGSALFAARAAAPAAT